MLTGCTCDLWPGRNVCRHANDEQLTLEMLREIAGVSADDGLEYDAAGITAVRTWVETEEPGLKCSVPVRVCSDASWGTISVDVGWGDPLVSKVSDAYHGAHGVRLRPALGWWPVRVCKAARLETLFGWKLHGLFERESPGLTAQGIPKGFWRPKDLYDLFLMAESNQLKPSLLAPAVEVAFSSLGYPLDRIVRVCAGRFGEGSQSKRNWARWRASLLDENGGVLPAGAVAIPERPAPAVEAIAPLCSDVLRRLGYASLPGEAVPIAPAWQIKQVTSLAEEASARLCARAVPDTVATAPASPPLAPPLAPAAARQPSATAPEPEVAFVIAGANPIKWEETKKVLAEWDGYIVPSEYRPPEALRFPPGLADGTLSAADAARALARHCHVALRMPCIVDLVYLELETAGGTTAYHRLHASDERPFAKRHDGELGTLRAVVGYCDGDAVEVFEGELEGRVVFPVRGAAPYGWNRCFLPDGCPHTLGELRDSFYAIHPRVKPLLELASRLRSPSCYGTLEANAGLFELHVTVRTPSLEQGGVSSFREACERVAVKAVLIENEGGDEPTQVMTASNTATHRTHVAITPQARGNHTAITPQSHRNHTAITLQSCR